RLYTRAHAASLYAPAVGLARRLRQRERVGGAARGHGCGQGRRRTVAHAGGTVKVMAKELNFDVVRLPAQCQALRQEVREFLAAEVAAVALNPHDGSNARPNDGPNIGPDNGPGNGPGNGPNYGPNYGDDAAYSEEFSRKVGARGWIGMTWPKRYGGGE